MSKIITIEKIEMSNFKCFGVGIEIDFSKDVVCQGKNGIGKTTIYDAICWCLYGHDSLNRSKLDFRTKGKGNVVEVMLSIDINGEKYEIHRAKHHEGTKSTQIIEINDAKISQKDYKTFLSTKLLNDDDFMLLSNPLRFFTLTKEKQRDKLISLNKDFPAFVFNGLEYYSNSDLINLKKTTKTEIDNIKKSIEKTNDAIDLRNKDVEVVENIINEYDGKVDKDGSDWYLITNIRSRLQADLGHLSFDRSNLVEKLATFQQRLDYIEEHNNAVNKWLSNKLKDLGVDFNIKVEDDSFDIFYNGIEYKLLSCSQKIIIGLKLIKAFQQKLDINCPIFVDNAESVEVDTLNDNIGKENQSFIFRVTNVPFVE